MLEVKEVLMRVLVAYGSKRGGTLGLAEWLTDSLREAGHEVTLKRASDVTDISRYDAVVVGGALYVFRWHADARCFVKRHRKGLEDRLVWLFSSGPLDDSAIEKDIEPIRFVRRTMARIGAEGHKTFGGRMLPDDKTNLPVGDWRDRDEVALWADEISARLRQTGRMELNTHASGIKESKALIAL
jgi:menaquinone-dependent protoporphyrinogen oxidase